MRAHGFRTFAIAAVTLFVLAAVVAPTASAAKAQLAFNTVNSPSQPIVPETGTGSLGGVLKYSFNNPLEPSTSAQKSAVPISFDFPGCPQYIVITGPRTLLQPIQAQTNSYDINFNFNIGVTRQAPGLQKLTCQITAQAGTVQQGVVDSSDLVQEAWTVTADFYSLVQAKVATKLQQAGPQKQVPFDIELSNFGNARTQVNFALGAAPEAGKWNTLLPEPIILDSPNTGEGTTTDTATFTVATPFKNGWNNEEGAFQVVMKPVAADQADKLGNEVTANVLVRVRGVYVPTLEPMVMLGAILGAGLVARMRREE